MLKKLSAKTNFILIGIIVGFFVGVSIKQIQGETVVPGTLQADNLLVNGSGSFGNGLVVSNGDMLVPNGKVGIGVLSSTEVLTVTGKVLSSGGFCIGTSCIAQWNDLKAMLSTGGSDSNLTITTTTPLPNGTVGVPYTTTLTATGGSGGLVWSFPGGSTSIPAGLTLNASTGVISGTPVASNVGSNLPFSVDVLSGGIHAGQLLTLLINPSSGASTYDLSFTKIGLGSVTGNISAIGDCTGSTCTGFTRTLTNGTTVKLTASPATGYTFTGWSGGTCSGNATTCSFTMTSVKSVTATFSSSAGACGDNITFPYNGSSVTYGTVTGEDGNCWMDRNLGATQVATSATDATSYGHLFQWGRDDDGHQVTTSGTTSTNADIPGNNLFITENSSPYDWRVNQDGTLWANSSSTNNPCPANWHVPTKTQWATWVTSAGVTNSATAYNSTLKLPLAGYRNLSTARLDLQSSNGRYWSSSPNGPNAYSFYFYSGEVNPAGNDLRALGFSVRCVKD